MSESIRETQGAVLSKQKLSVAERRARLTNILLMVVAFIMFGTFLIGAFLVTSNSKSMGEMPRLNIPKDLKETAPIDAESRKEAGHTEGSFEHIKPEVSSNPSQISLQATAGSEDTNSAHLSVAKSPIKVLDVSLSSESDTITITDTCVDEDSIRPDTGCAINAVYRPVGAEKIERFVNVRYTDITAPGNTDRDGTFRIPLVAVGEAAAVPAQTAMAHDPEPTATTFAAPATEPAESSWDDENEWNDGDSGWDDGGGDDWDEPATTAPAPGKAAAVGKALGGAAASGTKPAAAAIPARVAKPDDCKRYASKAYDFSGVFIGWAQGTKEVFSPNCARLIGKLMDDGTVVEAGTGRVLGRGAVMNSALSEEARIETALPNLRAIQRILDRDNWNPEIESVIENRQMAKAGDIGGTSEGNAEGHQADDPLGLLGKKRLSFVPFSIMEAFQISSDPKDERYVLRQGKPIPIVLTRPIEMGDLAVGEVSDAIATVERNVYGGDGRTVVIPSGTMLIGTAQEPPNDVPQRISRIEISWQRMIRPDGAEFNLEQIQGENASSTYTADAQGRRGVPGRNDTEHLRNMFIRPLLYSAMPVAMEMLFPTTTPMVLRARTTDGSYQVFDGAEQEMFGEDGPDWELDSSGNPRWEMMADMNPRDRVKNEVMANWNQTIQQMARESARQRIPFTVPVGTRLQVYLGTDIMLKIGEIEDMLNEARPGH